MKINLKCDSCEGTGRIKRECCEVGDILILQGQYHRTQGFCKHCGARFKKVSSVDAAGGSDWTWAKMKDEENE